MPTTLLKVIGAVIGVIGAWAALVAYAGPEFGYPMPPGSDQPAWEWSASHTWRHLLPGVAAILGGALLFGAKRIAAVIGGFVALAAGAWMILSPFVADAWLDRGMGGMSGDPSLAMQILTPLGYHHVPGILTIVLAGFALGGMLASGRRDHAFERDEGRAERAERLERERFDREPAGAPRS